jgi:hypothetical protein
MCALPLRVSRVSVEGEGTRGQGRVVRALGLRVESLFQIVANSYILVIYNFAQIWLSSYGYKI